MTQRTSRRRAAGLSILELLISVAIGLAVLSAMLYLYASSRQVYRTNEAVARVQEAGRFAMEILTRDLRQAGNQGCVSRGRTFPSDVTVIAVNARTQVLSGDAIFGFQVDPSSSTNALLTSTRTNVDNTTTTATWSNPTTVTRVAGDVLQLGGVYDTSVQVLDCTANNNCPQNANLRPSSPNNFKADDILIVTDCVRATIFCVTGINNQGEVISTSPSQDCNCKPNDNRAECAGAGNFRIDMKTFTASNRPFIAQFEAIDYFLGEPANRSGVRSLYRASTSLGTQEVVENVEDFSVEFGEDTNNDGVPDLYRRANSVANWKRVLTARIELVIVSPRQERAVSAGNRDFTFRGAAYSPPNPSENRFRQVFTSTVALRNRLP